MCVGVLGVINACIYVYMFVFMYVYLRVCIWMRNVEEEDNTRERETWESEGGFGGRNDNGNDDPGEQQRGTDKIEHS